MSDIELNYIYKEGILKSYVYIFDILLFSTITVLAGFIVSNWFNLYVNELDRNQKKLQIFFEIINELLLTMVTYFLLTYILPKLPSIVPNKNSIHLKHRSEAMIFLIAYAIITCQTKLNNKIVFLLNEEKDSERNIDDSIRNDFENCNNGFICAP